MSETATRATLTRDAVITATRQLVIDEGLENVSLRRAASALGVTAPALYAYVKDKRDLLRGIAEGELTELIGRFSAVTDPDPLVRVRRLARVYIDYALEQPELFKTIFLFPPDIPFGTASGEELPLATQAFEIPLTTVAEAVSTGAFKDVDPLMASLTLWTAIHGCASVLLIGFALDERSRDQLVDSVLDTTLAGLRA